MTHGSVAGAEVGMQALRRFGGLAQRTIWVATFATAFGGCSGFHEGDDPAHCGDGVDNDADGNVDCLDRGCAATAVCGGGDTDLAEPDADEVEQEVPEDDASCQEQDSDEQVDPDGDTESSEEGGGDPTGADTDSPADPGLVREGSLWVEVTWEHAGDDMDLHLLAPGGTMWSTKDCHWQNCRLGTGIDWGVQGNTGDDPKLIEDDEDGTGPEITRILSPAAGVYTVVVDDYPGSVYLGANDVTVDIYSDGTLVWSDTRPISGEETTSDGADNDVYFAKVSFPSGTVTEM